MDEMTKISYIIEYLYLFEKTQEIWTGDLLMPYVQCCPEKYNLGQWWRKGIFTMKKFRFVVQDNRAFMVKSRCTVYSEQEEDYGV